MNIIFDGYETILSVEAANAHIQQLTGAKKSIVQREMEVLLVDREFGVQMPISKDKPLTRSYLLELANE